MDGEYPQVKSTKSDGIDDDVGICESEQRKCTLWMFPTVTVAYNNGCKRLRTLCRSLYAKNVLRRAKRMKKDCQVTGQCPRRWCNLEFVAKL